MEYSGDYLNSCTALSQHLDAGHAGDIEEQGLLEHVDSLIERLVSFVGENDVNVAVLRAYVVLLIPSVTAY